jgi:hypothetical protein
MGNVKRTLLDILILGVVGAMAILIAIFLLLPSMKWSAIRKPSQIENRLGACPRNSQLTEDEKGG